MRNRIQELAPPLPPLAGLTVAIEPTLDGRSAECIEMAGLSGRFLLLVCDARTHAALGERLSHELGHALVRLMVLEGEPQPDEATVAKLRAEKAQGYIAVGSGTINDLCKYAAFLDDVSYVVFPTAPSMNGYISANASITMQGVKRSLPARLPAGAFCDLQVLAAAPPRLIRSGLGDSICRSTAQADWLLSHLLLGTPYDPLPFTLLQPFEDDLLKRADRLTQGDRFGTETLMRTLLASGIGMVTAGGSYPASQGEHLIAHAMEMKYGHALPPSYHGEQIAVLSLHMAQMQARILEHPMRVRGYDGWLETACAFFGEEARAGLQEAAGAKFARLLAQQEEIRDILATEQSSLRDALHHVMRPAEQLRAALARAGAPTNAGALGWGDEQLAEAAAHARFLRDRFTFLDVA